jgi:hypothetical protein
MTIIEALCREVLHLKKLLLVSSAVCVIELVTLMVLCTRLHQCYVKQLILHCLRLPG